MHVNARRGHLWNATWKLLLRGSKVKRSGIVQRQPRGQIIQFTWMGLPIPTGSDMALLLV